MPHIVIERFMTGADPDRVWNIARDLLSYPNFMDQVLSVEECDSPGRLKATAWVVLFNGNELRWIEEDRFFESERRMTFSQIEGDLAQWSGSFVALAQQEGTTARYEIDFDLGVPALADVLNPLGERAIRSNCEQMLEEMDVRSRVHANSNA